MQSSIVQTQQSIRILTESISFNFKKVTMLLRYITSACLLVCLLQPVVAQETINLVADQSQSWVTVSIPFLEADDVTSITGTATIELDSAEEPFSTAHITELNMTMADGFRIASAFRVVVIEVPENGANVSFVEVGPAGMVNGKNQFDQVGNMFGVTGTAFVDDPFQIVDTVDLATVKPVPFNVEGAQLTTDGNMITLAVDIDIPFEFEVLTTTAVMDIIGQAVFTGELPSFIIGDVNCDGMVDLLDVGPFVDAISDSQFNPKADINGDNSVDLLDVADFVNLLSGG